MSNYAIWGQSTDWRGVTGRTNRSDNNYGLYTPDNLYSNNINLAGAIMQVMENTGDAPLAPGDVVLFDGINRTVKGIDGPVVQVRRSDESQSTAVAGVVYSRFNVDAIDPALDSPGNESARQAAQMQVTPPGSAKPGEFVLVVVQGPAEVRVNALSGVSFGPGDLLASGKAGGQAGQAERMRSNEVTVHQPGTVLGKALEGHAGQELIYIYVTLQ